MGKICPKHVELILEISKYCYLLHLVGFAILHCVHWRCTVKHKSICHCLGNLRNYFCVPTRTTISHSISQRPVLIILFHLRLSLLSGSFPLVFETKMYIFLTFHMCALCPVHLALANSFAVITFSERLKLWSVSLCRQVQLTRQIPFMIWSLRITNPVLSVWKYVRLYTVSYHNQCTCHAGLSIVLSCY
jgi:hypothetical protein